MKVVVVDPWHFTPPYDRELCDGLAGAGHQVTFVRSLDAEDSGSSFEMCSGETKAGLTTLGLFSKPAPWLPRSLELAMKGLQHIRGLLRLLAALRKLRPDVIHFQWLSLPLIDAVFLPFFRRIAPVVLTVHDSNPYNGAGPWLLRAGSLMAMQRCDRFVVHNRISEQRLVERGLPADHIHRIAHGLLEQVTPEKPNSSTRTDKRVHFLQFGKLKAYKGADILLEAVASLEANVRERCRVSIVGRPYIDTQPLIDLVTRHGLHDVVDLRFDFVSDADMAALFGETDFLVFPYREIDTSGVLMAAAARGIPVVASDIGCFAEMLTDGEEGVLVPPGDPGALADAMTSLVLEPVKRTSMAMKMETLRQHIPSWAAIAEATTVVYERAQRQPVPRPLGVHI